MTQKILVTGADGQLGKCFRKIAAGFDDHFEFLFANSAQLDITDRDAVSGYFDEYQPHFCINTSAYTAVDLAESEPDRAFAVNADGVANLAESCEKYKSILIHFSTDYVFEGDTNIPYSEDNFTYPQGVYGASKLKGEELALELNPQTIILRTSWLYSEFNKNFVKSMLHLFSVKDQLAIVADQFGQPTNANDLAQATMQIIQTTPKTFGVFHFSNYPETTWFDFAQKIAAISGANIKIKPIATEEFPTAAKRPNRSTMSLDKIQEVYGIEPKNWADSLEDLLINSLQP